MRKTFVKLLATMLLLALSVGLAGCSRKDDTRQYVHSIGVVITNDMNFVFEELYVYDGEVHNMGKDWIDNRHETVKVGSYGVTVEEMDTYYVWLKDRRGTAYKFDQVPFEDADHAIISYTDELTLTVNHWNGGTDVIQGEIVNPDDAPDQPYNDLKKKVAYKFNVTNNTEDQIVFISMREDANQGKGEVELYYGELDPEKTETMEGKLYEEDKDITEWVLNIETDSGRSYVSTNAFDPWTATDITITGSADGYTFTVEPAEADKSASSKAGSSSAAAADSSSEESSSAA